MLSSCKFLSSLWPFCVTLVGDDITLVGDDITLVGDDVTLVGDDITLVGDDVTLVGDDVTLVGDDVTVVGDDITLVRYGFVSHMFKTRMFTSYSHVYKIFNDQPCLINKLKSD